MFVHGANSLLKYLSGLCDYSNASMVTYHPIGWLRIHSDPFEMWAEGSCLQSRFDFYPPGAKVLFFGGWPWIGYLVQF